MKGGYINKIWKLSLCFVLLSYIEIFALHFFDVKGSGSDYNIMTYPLAIVIFISCIQHPQGNLFPTLLREKLVEIGKYYAVDMYMYHVLIFSILELLLIRGCVLKPFVNAETTLIACIMLSFALKNLKIHICYEKN